MKVSVVCFYYGSIYNYSYKKSRRYPQQPFAQEMHVAGYGNFFFINH